MTKNFEITDERSYKLEIKKLREEIRHIEDEHKIDRKLWEVNELLTQLREKKKIAKSKHMYRMKNLKVRVDKK